MDAFNKLGYDEASAAPSAAAPGNNSWLKVPFHAGKRLVVSSRTDMVRGTVKVKGNIDDLYKLLDEITELEELKT